MTKTNTTGDPFKEIAIIMISLSVVTLFVPVVVRNAQETRTWEVAVPLANGPAYSNCDKIVCPAQYCIRQPVSFMQT